MCIIKVKLNLIRFVLLVCCYKRFLEVDYFRFDNNCVFVLPAFSSKLIKNQLVLDIAGPICRIAKMNNTVGVSVESSIQLNNEINSK